MHACWRRRARGSGEFASMIPSLGIILINCLPGNKGISIRCRGTQCSAQNDDIPGAPKGIEEAELSSLGV